ncbi:hypothetical protein HY990_04850 [Candidatus Micrarchaeota archaeon]|nr:hypothetical protein [Candidatus Micrarchaeota archaeon]
MEVGSATKTKLNLREIHRPEPVCKIFDFKKRRSAFSENKLTNCYLKPVIGDRTTFEDDYQRVLGLFSPNKALEQNGIVVLCTNDESTLDRVSILTGKTVLGSILEERTTGLIRKQKQLQIKIPQSSEILDLVVGQILREMGYVAEPVLVSLDYQKAAAPYREEDAEVKPNPRVTSAPFRATLFSDDCSAYVATIEQGAGSFNKLEVFDDFGNEGLDKLLSAKHHALGLARTNRNFRQLKGTLDMDFFANLTNEADTQLEGHEFVLSEARKILQIFQMLNEPGHTHESILAAMIGTALTGIGEFGTGLDDLLKPTLSLAGEYLNCLKSGLPKRILGEEYSPLC